MKPMSLFLAFFLLQWSFWSCQQSPDGPEAKPEDETISGNFAPKPVTLNPPRWMPRPPVDPNNPLTEEGIALGRMLFYDPILSRDSSLSCAGCHQQKKAFTDGLAKSVGIRGLNTSRSSMSLVNLVYNLQGMFWDGRTPNFESQALLPIEDHLEMDNTWDNVEKTLRRHREYPTRFRQAFGITKKSELNRDLVVKALSQFQQTLISANSRYDRLIWGREGFPTDEEQRGLELFFFEFSQTIDHPGCSHCHFNPLFADNNFHNNGLDAVNGLTGFKDLGRGGFSGKLSDNGKFRTPTLRNIELTAPYMHDGRFKTLEEVLDHYQGGGHGVANEDVNIRPFKLSAQDRQDLISFLKMLTDTSFINNPAFANPFKQ